MKVYVLCRVDIDGDGYVREEPLDVFFNPDDAREYAHRDYIRTMSFLVEHSKNEITPYAHDRYSQILERILSDKNSFFKDDIFSENDADERLESCEYSIRPYDVIGG